MLKGGWEPGESTPSLQSPSTSVFPRELVLKHCPSKERGESGAETHLRRASSLLLSQPREPGEEGLTHLGRPLGALMTELESSPGCCLLHADHTVEDGPLGEHTDSHNVWDVARPPERRRG